MLFGTQTIAADIIQIDSAEIYDCDGPARGSIGKRFLAYVEACVGHSSCTVQPSAAIPEQEMARAYCKGVSLKVKFGNAQVRTRAGHFSD